MKREPFTMAMMRIVRVLYTDGETYGMVMQRRAGLDSGTLYRSLYTLQNRGLVESHWETESAHVLGRPRRRYVRLTEQGETWARATLLKLGMEIPEHAAR